VTSRYRGAQGLDPAFIAALEKQFGFDKPAHRALLQDADWTTPASISAELFPRHQRSST
jgi:ABC-type microcin C transport system permease subunit YejB